MPDRKARVIYVVFGTWKYPIAHWEKLKRFVTGEEKDPKGLFRLRDDKWEAWPYAEHGRRTGGDVYAFRFHRLHSFLKPYVKWYCYQRLVGNPGPLRQGLPKLPNWLLKADRYIVEHNYLLSDDIALAHVFKDLWDAQVTRKEPEADEPLPHSAVITQEQTRAFWGRMRLEFRFPHIVPPLAVSVKKRPARFAADRDKLIPEAVTEQLGNRLGLHRDGRSTLRPFDHLRLCVMMLGIALGRRPWELLSVPRGPEEGGPLGRHPSAGGPPEGVLWFRFIPNKDGREDLVYVSSEWEDLVNYCVGELIAYGDRVRHLASPEERDLLILVSQCERTKGTLRDENSIRDVPRCGRKRGEAGTRHAGNCIATALTANALSVWLNGQWSGKTKGVLEEWKITADGSTNGAVYRMRLGDVRHSRHSALALDRQIDPLTLQRDLNHNERNMQFAYQHRLQESNDALLKKIKEGKIVGHGGEWLANLSGLPLQGTDARPCYKGGCPSALTPRFRNLLKNNPLFMQMNRVPGGICGLPQGPEGCLEYMNCTCAGEGGCSLFMTDVTDEQMLLELDGMAREQRRLQEESAAAGRVVQAEKREVRAGRTEALRDEALRRASREMVERLTERRREIELKGV